MTVIAEISIPIIFFLGLSGSLVPPILAKNLKNININENPLFRFFNGYASGIVIAVAFVHSIPDAFGSFNSVLTNGSLVQNYGWAGFLAMMGLILVLLLEEAITSQIGHHHHHVGDHMQDMKMKQNVATEAELGPVIEKPTKHDEKKTSTHAHDHYSLDVYFYSQLYLLLFGLSFHSFFVGLALGIVSKPLDLFIAIVAHQFFEGLALGARVADANFQKKYMYYYLMLHLH